MISASPGHPGCAQLNRSSSPELLPCVTALPPLINTFPKVIRADTAVPVQPSTGHFHGTAGFIRNERWRNPQQVDDGEVNGERLQSTPRASLMGWLAKGNDGFDGMVLFFFPLLEQRVPDSEHSTAPSTGSETEMKANC